MDLNICLRKPLVYPTKPDTTIAVGDRVRSFDFPCVLDCYFVGTVVRIDGWREQYVIDVEYQIWEGERAAENYYAQVRPPVNGAETLMGIAKGVQRVQRGEE